MLTAATCQDIAGPESYLISTFPALAGLVGAL